MYYFAYGVKIHSRPPHYFPTYSVFLSISLSSPVCTNKVEKYEGCDEINSPSVENTVIVNECRNGEFSSDTNDGPKDIKCSDTANLYKYVNEIYNVVRENKSKYDALLRKIFELTNQLTKVEQMVLDFKADIERKNRNRIILKRYIRKSRTTKP